jgi:hypothetical protein
MIESRRAYAVLMSAAREAIRQTRPPASPPIKAQICAF